MTQSKANNTSRPRDVGSIRTLVTGDSAVTLQTLIRFLARDQRIEVIATAGDGRRALITAASLNPQLVLVDLHLPHVDGVEVTRCLKQFQNPPIVFMVTCDGSIAAHTVSVAAGADAFLVKSGNLPDQLESKLRERFGPVPPPRVDSAATASGNSSMPNLLLPMKRHNTSFNHKL